MRVSIRDRDALLAVSPTALTAYARAAGWTQRESYREHSEIFAGEKLPEIILPLTKRLGDYASVVSELIEVFAEVTEQDEVAVYRSLVNADRDLVRVRAGASDDGSVGLNEGVDLIRGARDMLLSVACSLGEPKAVYRAGANKEASKLVDRVRLGPTDHGSFIVTLLTPVVPPSTPKLLPDAGHQSQPPQRKLTLRLIEALRVARKALERAAVGDERAFADSVEHGVSANLCEALCRIVRPFPMLDVRVSWARTRMVSEPLAIVRFGQNDTPLLSEAARALRELAPQPDVRLRGFIRVLKRVRAESGGTIQLATTINKRRQSVMAVLERSDYEQAVQAHKEQAPVILDGDLERVGQRWRLLIPRLTEIVRDEEAENR